MAQLRQRISSVIRLEPFSTQETNDYIDHRLWVAGYAGPPLFTVGARLLIGQHSGGIPRNINNLCFHSMTLASATEKKQVDSQMVREAIADLAIDSVPAALAQTRTSSPEPAAAPLRLSPARGETLPTQLTVAPKSARRLIPAVVVVFAVLFLGLVSGASWKTDAGSVAPAAPPAIKASVLPAPMTPIEPAPETLPSQSSSSPLASPSGLQVDLLSTPRDVQTAQDPRVISVVIEKNITLRHVSLLYLDRFDPPTLAAIRLLNPAIKDPNRIEAGQEIRLPLYLHRDLSDRVTDALGSRFVMGKPENSPGGQP